MNDTQTQIALLLVLKPGVDIEAVRAWLNKMAEKPTVEGVSIQEFDASTSYPTIYLP